MIQVSLLLLYLIQVMKRKGGKEESHQIISFIKVDKMMDADLYLDTLTSCPRSEVGAPCNGCCGYGGVRRLLRIDDTNDGWRCSSCGSQSMLRLPGNGLV